ncbi:MAG: phenylalanine--tRNA ligase subunit alpha [Filifactoraceae bacterium]
MRERLEGIKLSALEELRQATSMDVVEDLRVKFLGKKSELQSLLKEMGKLTAEERPIMGKVVNEVRDDIENIIKEMKDKFKAEILKEKLKSEIIDVTMPVKMSFVGKQHPITIVTTEIEKIFMSMGFSVKEGPEVDTVENNFDRLNSPKNHPSREMSDTFYFSENLLLRTHTSPVQVRTMMSEALPIRMISPGRCFRYDTPDATHSPMFHQVEGLVVGEGINFANLKATLEEFAIRFFGKDTKTKFRPHNFPFTEPSAEVDVTCFKCDGKGCAMCKGEGFIEILGAGMVHPNVLENCGIDSTKYSGFAFGMGVERIAMLKYEIDDIRLMYENDMRFLSQF